MRQEPGWPGTRYHKYFTKPGTVTFSFFLYRHGTEVPGLLTTLRQTDESIDMHTLHNIVPYRIHNNKNMAVCILKHFHFCLLLSISCFFLLSEERSHSLPLSSFLSPRFHLQGRQALLWHKLKKVRRDNERKLSFISPWFLVVVSTAAEARQNALGRKKRERDRLYVRVRGSIVYCLLCNSQRMALISRADCDTEPWWGTEGIMLFHNYLSPSLSLLL